MANSVTEKGKTSVHCAYCEAPITEDVSSIGSGKPYCCYGCRLLGESGHKAAPSLSAGLSAWFRLVLGSVLAGQSMLIGLAVNISPPEGGARWLLHGVLVGLTATVFGLLGWPLLRSSGEAIQQRRITIEFLFVVGILGALGASLFSTFRGQGDVYYEVAAILLAVYAAGKTIGAESRARALSESRKLHETFDVCRCLQPDGTLLERKVAQIQKGERVLIYSGEAIPVDGRIEKGQAFVRETPMSGEPYPVVRRTGDEVIAGSYAEDGDLVVVSSAKGYDRRLDGLLRAVEQAREQPSCLQAQADRLVSWFLPLVLLTALGTFLFWTSQDSWRMGLFNSLAVLLVACPCAMGLATPIGLWNGLAALAARGLVARSGDLIDQLGRVTQVVFDKTGTLSENSLSLIDLAHRGGVEERSRLMDMVRSVQARCPHPVARAFVGFSESLPAEYWVKAVKMIPAKGIEAWIITPSGNEHFLRVGQRQFISHHQGESDLLGELKHAAGDHLIYIEVDGGLQGIAAVRERLRDSTRHSIRALKGMGIQCQVMTGDSLERATALGLEDVRGGMTPQEKAEAIQANRRSGEWVCFVGDGINDAPALMAAQAGIALEHGAGLATATAGGILHGGDLRVVPWAIEVCRQIRSSIHSNLYFAGSYNLIGIGLAATGNLHPVAASLLMVISSFTVSWRALRSSRDGAFCCNLLSPKVSEAKDSHEGVDETSEDIRLKEVFVSEPEEGERGPQSNPTLGFRSQRERRTRGGAENVPKDAPLRGGLRRTSRIGQIVDCLGSLHSGIAGADSHRCQALLILLQAPFIIYLGQLRLGPSFMVAALWIGMASGIYRFHSTNLEWRRIAVMTFAMLGAGNWGMILGWWADAGFAPVAFSAEGHCCASHGGYSMAGILQMPWMYLGMILFGLPPMMADPAVVRSGLRRFTLTVLSILGMVLGMSFGSYLFLKWLGPNPGDKFLVSLAGMTVGMIVGMHFCCELGRALFLKWRYPA